MRLFAAILIPPAASASLEKFVQDLRKLFPASVRAHWVSPDNYHLTLKFFGEVLESRAESLGESLDAALSGRKAFSFALKGIGFFPNAKRPRVFWAGAEDSSDLAEVALSVEESTVRSGFAPSDKPFSAHLTLARFESPVPSDFIQAASSFSGKVFGEVPVSQIDLMRSRPTPKGPVYTSIRPCRF